MDDIFFRAAEAIRNAGALVITAGAGMGVDSGLPDFRGDKGFWQAYPMYERLGISFVGAANPEHFERDPPLAGVFTAIAPTFIAKPFPMPDSPSSGPGSSVSILIISWSPPTWTASSRRRAFLKTVFWRFTAPSTISSARPLVPLISGATGRASR